MTNVILHLKNFLTFILILYFYELVSQKMNTRYIFFYLMEERIVLLNINHYRLSPCQYGAALLKLQVICQLLYC